MAGGGIDVGVAGARAAQYEAKITPAVIIICLIAASGGLLFGYDIGRPLRWTMGCGFHLSCRSKQ